MAKKGNASASVPPKKAGKGKRVGATTAAAAPQTTRRAETTRSRVPARRAARGAAVTPASKKKKAAAPPSSSDDDEVSDFSGLDDDDDDDHDDDSSDDDEEEDINSDEEREHQQRLARESKPLSSKKLQKLAPLVSKTKALIKKRMAADSDNDSSGDSSDEDDGDDDDDDDDDEDSEDEKRQKQQSKGKSKGNANSKQTKKQRATGASSTEEEPTTEKKKTKKKKRISKATRNAVLRSDIDHGRDAHGNRIKVRDIVPPVAPEELARRGTVYLGHIPFGFFETQMRSFFSQFGDITRLRLARNKRTGKSKHYAFIEFKLREVAEVVAETMNRYMMFTKTLVCELVENEDLHPDTFKGANRAFRKVPHQRLSRERHNAGRTDVQQQRRVARLVKAESKKRKRLAALGVDYELSSGGYAAEAAAAGIEVEIGSSKSSKSSKDNKSNKSTKKKSSSNKDAVAVSSSKKAKKAKRAQ